jgi:hypothetical protein
MLAVAVGVSTALLAGACSSSGNGASVTVTSQVTIAPSSDGQSGSGQTGAGQSTAGQSSAQPSVDGNGMPVRSSGATSGASSSGSASSSAGSSKTPASSSSTSKGATSSSAGPAGSGSYDHPQDGVALPDGFVPKKLKPGQKPPQFVVVSFDGVGWDEKWQYWFDMAKQVPFRFTGFLSGTYMLTEATKDHYQGPLHARGASDINWNLPTDLPV